MKYWLRKLVPGLLLFSLLTGSAMAQGRIGTVGAKLSKIIGKKEAVSAIEERRADFMKEGQAMLAELKKGKEDYTALLADANNQALSTEERDKRKKSGEEKFKQLKLMEDNIREYESAGKTRLDEQALRMRTSLITEIRSAVAAPKPKLPAIPSFLIPQPKARAALSSYFTRITKMTLRTPFLPN